MSEAVLRDVITKMALDPAFATVVNTKPSVALRHVDLSVPERDLIIKLSRGGVHRRVGVADINVPDVRRRLSTLSPAAVDKLRGLGRRPPSPSPGGDGTVAVPGAAVVGGLRGGGRALQGIGRALQEAGTSVGGGTGQLIAGAGESLTKFGDALDNFASSLTSLDLNGAIRGVGDVLSAGLAGIGSFLSGLGDALGIPALVTAGAAVSDFASSVFSFFDVAADVVSGAVSDAVQAMSDAAGAVAGAIADGVGLVVDAVVGFFQSLFGSGEGQQQAPPAGQGSPGPGEPAPAPGDSSPGPGEPAPQPDNPPAGDTTPPAPPPGDSSSADTGDLGGGATGGTGPGFGTGGAGSTPGRVGAGGGLGIGARGRDQPAGGFGSGDVDPVDTALGHVALTVQAGLRNAAASARAATVPADDGGPGGSGPAEPGTGGPAGTGGARAGSFSAVTGSSVDLSQLARRFNVDPNPEQLQAAFGRAAAQLQALTATGIA